MVKILSEAAQAALTQRTIVTADFIRVVARNRDTNALEPCNLWSGLGNVTAQVWDPRDRVTPKEYAFYGFGGLLQIDDIVATSSIQSQDVHAKMSHIDPLVDQMFRGYDCNKAEVLMWRGLFDPATRNLVDPGFCRLLGIIDFIEVHEPSENEEGYVDFVCNSNTVELFRYNPDTRSHESQILRHAGDNFFEGAETIGDREIFWGRFAGKIASQGGGGGKPRGKPTGPVGGGHAVDDGRGSPYT